MKRGILAGVLVLSMFAVVAPSSVVIAQEGDLEILSATLHSEEIEEGDGYRITFEYKNNAPQDVLEGVPIYANGREIMSPPVEAEAGERSSYTFWITEPDDAGEYTIAIGSPTGVEAGELVVKEERSLSTGFFGTAGKVVGGLILGLGLVFYLGGIGVEVLRGFKEYVGDGTDRGMKPAVIATSIGSVGMITGGVLFGGLGTVLAFVGLAMLIVLGVLFGGYYGVAKVYQEL